jgi:hypothetical protein
MIMFSICGEIVNRSRKAHPMMASNIQERLPERPTSTRGRYLFWMLAVNASSGDFDFMVAVSSRLEPTLNT